MKRILFQGDSITDCGRARDNDNSLGMGYPNIVKGQLGLKYPNEYAFLNRGVSGDRIVDIYARIRRDLINLNPDYLSILIGVNDVWHEVDGQNGVASEKYEMVYSLVLDEVKAHCPNIKIMILEPFVLQGCATVSSENPDRWNQFSSEVAKRAAAAKRIAEKHNAVFVPLQVELDRVSKLMPNDQILGDGVHPTAIGHQIITNAWIKAFEEIK